MKKILILILLIISVESYSQLTAKKSPTGRGYLEYLPNNYDPSKKYPCIIFLHGSGERGDGSPAQLERVKNQGIPKLIKNNHPIVSTLGQFIILSPQQYTTRDSWEGKELMPFVKWALTAYPINQDQVYLTGLSMGGDGTWMNSYAIENEPNVFAAIAPVTGKGDYKQAMKTAQKKIPVKIFWAEKDTAVPYNDGRNPFYGMNDWIKANPSPDNISPIWVVIPGGTHSGGTWDKVYGDPTLYEWFLSYGEPAEIPDPLPLIELSVYFDPNTNEKIFVDSNGKKY